MKYRITRDVRVDGRHMSAGYYDDLPKKTISDLLAAGAVELPPEYHKPVEKVEIKKQIGSKITASVAIVLTCHDKYLKVLPNQIRAVDNQTHKANEKFLVLDGCDYTPPEGWQVIKGEWKEPNPGRNVATLKAKSDWLIYVDADDEMNINFIEAIARQASYADNKTGIIYADINRGGSITRLPEKLNFIDQLSENYISASCCWRRHAITESGLFPENNDHYDDWTLANALMFRGWKTEYQSEISIDCYPPQNKELSHRSENDASINKWNHRSYTIVTLLAGRINCFPQWLDYLQTEDKPNHVKLLIVDNSHNELFNSLIWQSVLTLKGFESIEIRKSNLKIEEIEGVNRWGDWGSRHLHVSRIYTEILPLVNTDMTVFLEDDVIPEKGALKQLIDRFILRSRIGGISAVYPSRLTNPDSVRIVGAAPDDYWHNCYTMDDLPKDGSLMHAGFIAGGFSLWRTGIVLKSLPLCWDTLGTILRGWDTRLCLQARQMGWQLFIDPKVICKHLVNEDKNTMIETTKDIAIEGKHCPEGTRYEGKEENKLIRDGVAKKVIPEIPQAVVTLEEKKEDEQPELVLATLPIEAEAKSEKKTRKRK